MRIANLSQIYMVFSLREAARHAIHIPSPPAWFLTFLDALPQRSACSIHQLGGAHNHTAHACKHGGADWLWPGLLSLRSSMQHETAVSGPWLRKIRELQWLNHICKELAGYGAHLLLSKLCAHIACCLLVRQLLVCCSRSS